MKCIANNSSCLHSLQVTLIETTHILSKMSLKISINTLLNSHLLHNTTRSDAQSHTLTPQGIDNDGNVPSESLVLFWVNGVSARGTRGTVRYDNVALSCVYTCTVVHDMQT